MTARGSLDPVQVTVIAFHCVATCILLCVFNCQRGRNLTTGVYKREGLYKDHQNLYDIWIMFSGCGET